jgi:hypothetical protein
MARIESEGTGWNTYDCRICRREGFHRDERACLFDLDSVMVSVDGDAALPVDRDTAVVLCNDPPGGNILSGFRRWKDQKDRELCFVPCIRRDAQELLSREIDAGKYHWATAPTAWTVQAFRTIRAERAGCANDQYKRMRDKHGH